MDHPSSALRPHLGVLARLVIGMVVGAGCGVLGTVFMTLLDGAEHTRSQFPNLVFALPVAGCLIGIVYQRVGQPIARGNNLLIEALCDGGPVLPHRMMPMGILGTVAVHLFGGSVGQEGTAMQLGASLGDGLHHRLGLARTLRPAFLAAGVAGGFGAVFGAPGAAAVFALEFCVAGHLTLQLLPCVTAAALMADGVATSLGLQHPNYPIPEQLTLSLGLALRWMVFAAAIAGVATLFITLTDAIRTFSQKYVPSMALRLAAGGVAVLTLRCVLHTDTYLGGGIPQVLAALGNGDVSLMAWLFKLLFTAISLGTGFMGGEVTPLFFMGATFGHDLGAWLCIPVPMAAAVGMAAILSSATKTPLAWVMFLNETMGQHMVVHALWVCCLATAFSGKHRIYAAQRGHEDKRQAS